jgi:hypothetical protein
VYHIYPTELEIKDTTNTARSASYLDIHLENDMQVRLRIKPHYKIDDVISPIVNCSCIYNNIPTLPTYAVYISQLIETDYRSGSPEFIPDLYWVRMTRSLVSEKCFVDHYLSFSLFLLAILLSDHLQCIVLSDHLQYIVLFYHLQYIVLYCLTIFNILYYIV